MEPVLTERVEPGRTPAAAAAWGREAPAAGLGAGFARSAASWPAILAGAFVAVAVSLILIVLGSGIGFAAAAPGHTPAGLTVAGAIWLIVTQWISAALGGYVAGRLRTKWAGTHTHEVFFRDTAHGLITWSVATVFVAWVVAGSASSLLGGGLRAAIDSMSSASPPPGASAEARAAAQGPASTQMTYEIDRLFRPSPSSGAAAGDTEPVPAQNASDARVETLYIAYHAVATGSVPDADRSYLAELVSAQAGVTSAEARRRVEDFVSSTLSAAAEAKANADTARKAAAQASIYTALSLLLGAFIASVAAAIGGRLRDLQQH